MRRLSLIFLSLISAFPLFVSAYSISCSSVPGGAGCGQCFHFDLAGSNRPQDIFVPRSGLTSAQQEVITQSTITGETFQGASVSPVGTITNLFDITNSGSGQSAWIWAKMKSSSAVTKGNIPSNTNYSNPVYVIKYLTKSSIRENNTIVPGTEVSHLECGFFYAAAPQVVTCGNGIREGSEQCDDGNLDNNDSCTSACRYPVCGNGVREGNEQCDDGNSNNYDACSNTCTSALCGNGTRENDEQCDDGNSNNNDSCMNNCRFPQVTPPPGPTCGNGVREGNEQCDDGNGNNNDTCTNSCTVNIINPRCNVQVLDSYGSAPLNTSILCSGQPQGRTVIAVTKNNTVMGTFESTNTPYTFSQVGRYTVHCYPDARDQSNSCRTVVDVGAVCGNGVIERGEQCDDGNTFSGDSCDRYCRVAGSTCGNGILERGEQCDDGNNFNGDRCSNICESSTPATGPVDIFFIILIVAASIGWFVTYKRQKR